MGFTSFEGGKRTLPSKFTTTQYLKQLMYTVNICHGGPMTLGKWHLPCYFMLPGRLGRSTFICTCCLVTKSKLMQKTSGAKGYFTTTVLVLFTHRVLPPLPWETGVGERWKANGYRSCKATRKSCLLLNNVYVEQNILLFDDVHRNRLWCFITLAAVNNLY